MRLEKSLFKPQLPSFRSRTKCISVAVLVFLIYHIDKALTVDNFVNIAKQVSLSFAVRVNVNLKVSNYKIY